MGIRSRRSVRIVALGLLLLAVVRHDGPPRSRRRGSCGLTGVARGGRQPVMQRDEGQVPMPDPLGGGCFCGAVRYEVGAIIDAGYCRCSICRRMSGSPAIAWATAERAKFRLTSGCPRAYRSSEHWARYFCEACGSPVYQCNPDDSGPGQDSICILIPGLDDPEAVRPSAHIWCSSGLSYFETTDDSPRFPRGEMPSPEKRSQNRAE